MNTAGLTTDLAAVGHALRNVGYRSSAAVSKRAKVPGKAVESGPEARLAY